MSLWSTPLERIQFSDVAEFLHLQIPEGAQIDYKESLPDHIEKTVSAFANTNGGLIILGVAEDKKGRPLWPPKGFAAAAGLREQITQQCRDRIHPPLIPELSPIIANLECPETDLLVVRVQPSAEAPHAIFNRRSAYVRTDSVATREDLADVEFLQHLFERRGRIEQKREQLVQRSVRRSRVLLDEGVRRPMAWACCTPYFPREPLSSVQHCWNEISSYGACQQAPDGAISVLFDELRYRNGSQPPDKRRVAHKYVEIGSFGHIFSSIVFFEVTFGARAIAIDATAIQQLLRSTHTMAKSFYGGLASSPGLLLFQVGLEGAAGRHVSVLSGGNRPRFPDHRYRAMRSVECADLCDRSGRESDRTADHLLEEVMAALDVRSDS